MDHHGTGMQTERYRYGPGPIDPPDAGIRGEDYLVYRPLMLKVLGRLARDGYVIPPDDGLDLVHDFFVEAWPRVVTQFDAGKAQFPTYLYLSFSSFARPRIVKLIRWRTTLVDPHDIARLHGPEDAIEAQQERSSDAYLLEAVVGSMTQQDRVIFQLYMHGSGSERQIANHFGITRYRLRSKLADIFGNVAVKLGDMSAFPEPFPSVVIALWRDHRTPREAASYLKITVPEVQSVRNRMFRLLAQNMKGYGDMALESVRAHGVDASEAVDVPGLLARAAGEPSEARDEAIDEIRKHSEAVLSYFEDGEAELPHDHADARTYARIYLALAGEAEDKTLREADLPYVMAYERGEILIGEAFRQSLLPGLPKRLHDLSSYFLGLDVVELIDRDRLAGDPTVGHGGPGAMELLVFGLTPAHLVTAAHAVASLARREADKAGSRPGSSIRLADVAVAGPHIVSLDQAIEQVALVAELNDDVARRVTLWLKEVAGFVPLLFNDFIAEPDGDGLTLTLTDETEDDLHIRWRATPRNDTPGVMGDVRVGPDPGDPTAENRSGRGGDKGHSSETGGIDERRLAPSRRVREEG